MFSASPIRGDGTYYQNLAQTDYYTEGGEPPGRWRGTGAMRLGLVDQEITGEALNNLLMGFSPDGSEKFVNNAGKENRHKGYDITFSAPKDVSIAWAASPRWMQLEIQRAQQAAVDQTIKYVEDYALYTRRGKQGAVVEQAKAIVAVYEHSTSRAEEPQLHSHCLFANICLREDSTKGTFYGRVITDKHGNKSGINPLLEHGKSAGAVYQMALATELRERLGFKIVPAENGFSFEIEGVSKEAGEHYSTRRRQIEEEMKQHGFESAEAAEIANFATRQEKREVNRAELFEKWQDKLAEFGMTPERLLSLCNKAERFEPNTKRIYEAIRDVEKELIQENGTFTQAQLFEKTANKLVASGDRVEDLNAFIEKEIHEGQIVSLGRERLQRVFSSQENLQTEYRFSEYVALSQRNTSFKVGQETIDKAIQQAESKNGFKFDERYRSAVSYLAGGIQENEKRVGGTRVLIGDAGSGKTTLLGVVRSAFELEGYNVVGAALAGKAADVLQQKAGIKSATLDKWNITLNDDNPKTNDHLKLDSKTALVIDEAAMTDTSKLFQLYERAQKAGALVIFSGDEKQCQAIGHGGGFVQATRIAGATRISENFRQKNPLDRKIAELIATGKSDTALRELAKKDALKVSATKDKAIEKLVDDWAHEGARKPEENQIVVSTNADRQKINELCQQRRFSAHKRKLGVGVENHEGQQIFRGDRIIFGENLILKNQSQSFREFVSDHIKQSIFQDQGGTQRVRNGQFGTVLYVNPLSDTLRVKMDDGRLLSVPLSVRDESKKNVFGKHHTSFAGKEAKRKVEISLGYASTTHAGQGSEFKNMFAMLGGTMQDRELSYVQFTRHVESANFYTTQTEAGKELLLRSLLNKAKAEQNKERAEALQKQIDELFKENDKKMPDSILAKRMARSNKKEFALEMLSPAPMNPEMDR